MKGSIRFILGLFLAWGAVGGMDHASDLQMITQVALAAAGLAIMYSGARALKEQYDS
jgi:hypothetical protein